MDFRNVADLFADKDFDGDPVMIKIIADIDEKHGIFTDQISASAG